MSKTVVKTDNAPAAIGPYSQGVVTNGLLFTSGQLPIDPATGKIPQGTIAEKAAIVFKNLGAIAKEAGTSLDNAVKITVFLADINDFAAVNEVYAQYFKEPFPARSAFQVAALPLGAELEVEGIFQL
ncbi:endoribonuclease L-PSP [Desulfocicer vacuolatum DSM 3385]|uniref:Endoribonuclease L-PSP n=1 Tax=Desulfocicer vacuolatum DSM 3385 TaxID=1121400 RepID=A0A1W2DYG5_9BACT|nr:RidA family protein [Desulfocicer vacuolatum]SMD02479.1 endoribonuclease L-PSP [Desulfocicer vacuolatum DSM 3385]